MDKREFKKNSHDLLELAKQHLKGGEDLSILVSDLLLAVDTKGKDYLLRVMLNVDNRHGYLKDFLEKVYAYLKKSEIQPK